MRSKNPLGFLGLVGLIGLVGVAADSPTLVPYFAYLGYFFYFTQPFSGAKRNLTLTALAAAYILAFTVNLAVIVGNAVLCSIDYESGFYLSYVAGSYGFPLVSGSLEVKQALQKRRSNGVS
jgi:hypothetical protein